MRALEDGAVDEEYLVLMFTFCPHFRIFVLMGLLASASGFATAQAQADSAAAVQQRVLDWAEAWQAGRFDEYASYYTLDFKGEYASSEKWREVRRSRVEKRTDIRISLGPVLVELNSENERIARAIFLQHYRSDAWCDVVEKTLLLVLTERGWRIDEESSRPRTRC